MTQGDSIGFGDLSIAISQSGGAGNTIRAMLLGGSLDSGNSDTIQYTTIGTKGKFQDFGDLSSGRQTVAVVSTSVQATATAGATSGDTVQNIIEFVNIMTIGNAIDFGDLTLRKDAGGANGHSSNHVRGLLTGGYSQPASDNINNIDFINIATAGNAQDFGDCSVTAGWGYVANTTDSHGGLGGF